MNSKSFIEKGTVGKDDSAIYNKESITTNQIKSDEFLLKDETQCGWVVGYVASNREGQDGVLVPVEFESDTIENLKADDANVVATFNTYDEWQEAYRDLAVKLGVIQNAEYSCSLDIAIGKLVSTEDTGITCTMYKDGSVNYRDSAFNNNTYLHSKNSTASVWDRMVWDAWLFSNRRKELATDMLKNWKPLLSSLNQQVADRANVDFIDANATILAKMQAFTKDKPVFKIAGKFYQANLKTSSLQSLEDYPTYQGEMFNIMNNNINRNPRTAIYYIAGEGADTISGTAGPQTYKFKVQWIEYSIELEEILPTVSVTFGESFEVPVLSDAPYHMFAIPFSNDLTLYSGDTVHCARTNKSVAIAVAQQIAAKAGVGAVYDVQLLPYCPIRDCISTTVAPENNYTLSSGGTYNTKPIRRGGVTRPVKPLQINRQYYVDPNRTITKSIILRSDSIIPTRFASTFDDTTVTYNPHQIAIIPNTGINLLDSNGSLLHQISWSDYIAQENILNIELTDVYEVETEEESYKTVFKDIEFYGRGDTFITKVDIGKTIHTDITTVVGTSTKVINTILWANSSKFSFNISLANNLLQQASEDGTTSTYVLNEVSQTILNETLEGENAVAKKVKGQTDNLRLASPNYSNFFDINVQYNNGVDYFNVDCTYKPFQPYIHLNPNFKGLYGGDYDDTRGLICGGDYSIALITDAWATYELQNKNYMLAFDRNMQVLETQNRIQHEKDIWNAVSGTVVGAGAGALTGAKLGGAGGAIAGAVIGGVASGIGGAADVQNNDLLRNLNYSNTRDQFGYQLDNIKALPYGLAKTSALTNNNKIFPYLEYYTCTPEETHALEEKITYNGMTIERIGSPRDFKPADTNCFLKGRIIKINITDDFHMAAVINDEFNKGVYL